MYVWMYACVAAFGGFVFGYDVGGINGVKEMEGFRDTFGIPYTSDNGSSICSEDVEASATLGLIVSVLSFGALVGALLAGMVSEFISRRVAIIIGAIVFTLGAAVQTGALFLWMILLGRIISGLGVGFIMTEVPVYIAELAPKKVRGRLVSFIAIGVTTGILTGIVVNFVSQGWLFGWRISLGVQFFNGSIYVIGMVFLPETPRWLVKKGKNEKAAKVLSQVHKNEEEVEDELNGMQAALQESEKQGFWSTLKVIFHWNTIHRLVLGMTLQLLNRLVGLHLIFYYSVSIFCKIGLPLYTSLVIGIVNVLGTISLLPLVDKLGRKVLLLLGALGMMFSMLVSATLILVFTLEEGKNKEVGYVVVVLISFFIVSFSSSLGPIAWVFNSEIHPLRVRGISVSLATSAFWIGNIILAQTTPIMLASPLQTYGTFYYLAGINLLAFLFVLFTLPETKGLSLESIGILFSKPWLERTQILYYLRPWKWCRKRSRMEITKEKEMYTQQQYELLSP